MMKYKLKVYIISEIGQRANQEDSVFPAPGQQQDSDRLFVLCDGMGGHEAGEVASSTVCQAISKSVFTNVPDAEGEFSDEQFYQALTDAYEALDEKDTTDTTGRKMGTTMTFLKLHADGCTIAHMGDSRVYHIRPGKDIDDTKILFRTEDHSLVNDLVKIGELTPEEARTSKQKNIITRAMQPHMERRPKADIYHSSDIRPGDYFYMCTDGMLEQMEDDNIRFNFSEKRVMMIIKLRCSLWPHRVIVTTIRLLSCTYLMSVVYRQTQRKRQRRRNFSWQRLRMVMTTNRQSTTIMSMRLMIMRNFRIMIPLRQKMIHLNVKKEKRMHVHQCAS